MKKVGEETYFVSSTSTSAGAGASAKDKDTTHFIGRKIAPVPIPPKRFVLIKQSLPGVLAIGEVEVISNGVNVALHKSVQNSGANTYILDTSKTPSLSQTHTISTGNYTISTGNHANTKSSNIVDGTKLGFKSYSILNDGWVMIDLGSEYTISNIKIQDLTEGDVVTPAKGLVVFLSSESIDGNQTLQQLKDNPKVDIVGITALQFAANQGHEFLLSETELDLWRGDMLKTTKTSVRCLQDDTKPLIVPTKVENNIIINKPMEPIKFVNYASGGVNKWSISHQLPSGLVFDKQKGIISGTPTKILSKTNMWLLLVIAMDQRKLVFILQFCQYWLMILKYQALVTR
ncbi:hypothetical protein BSPWISOXPB_2418 [uncultured Gammaproteobacteria bacterium]|nr:hypothetical protein BSPWISOXPB_2418 [uncultured Gammaproteobacteria bacterium]